MAQKLVFITGATGFIGAQTTDSVLKAGYRVRLSIRKAEQESGIRKRHAAFQGNVETVIVPDLSKPESFEKALDGVDYILHIASPMPGTGNDFVQDYQNPAVDGTLAILETALKFKKLQKVIIVSSVLALVGVEKFNTPEFHVKENTGEKIAVDLSKPFPDGPAGYGPKYHASKILAHQATRDFVAARNPHFAVITLHPVFVLGGSLIRETAEDIGGINAMLLNSINSGTPVFGNTWVHVQDVADAHVKVLENDIPSGTEFILASPSTSWDRAARVIQEKFPELESKLQGPFNRHWTAQTDAADQLLGIKWQPQEKIVEDVFNQHRALQSK